MKLYAGTGRTDITPELGHNLQGWLKRREATRIDARLPARALILDDETSRLVFLTCDLLGIPEPLNSDIKRAEVATAGPVPACIRHAEGAAPDARLLRLQRACNRSILQPARR